MRSTSLNVLVTGLSIAVSAVFCTNCYDGLDGDDLELSPDSLDPRAFVHTAHVWAKPAAIPVCWENPGPGDATARSWVQQSVMNTWSRFGAVDFTGWGPCSANAKGIRILIADGHPHTKGLGKQLNGVKDGMLLNFTFNAWGNICHQYPGVENCIRWIAAHEFGHALGFAHEQNRPDTPAWCKEPPQGSNGDLIIGAWDEDSIMNYCNDKYTNLGELSTTDVAALQAVYGPRYRWASLGGGVSSIAVGRNLDGRLEVFARGTDSALWHTWQTTPNGGWSGWASLGGGILATPAIAANSDGRLEAFVQGTDGALWHNWQTTPNGAWSGWASLGGWLANPAVGRNHDGRLEVFGVGSDSAVYHIWQNTPSGSWSGWSGMGGVARRPDRRRQQLGRPPRGVRAWLRQRAPPRLADDAERSLERMGLPRRGPDRAAGAGEERGWSPRGVRPRHRGSAASYLAEHPGRRVERVERVRGRRQVDVGHAQPRRSPRAVRTGDRSGPLPQLADRAERRLERMGHAVRERQEQSLRRAKSGRTSRGLRHRHG
jgi:hypothetical protein